MNDAGSGEGDETGRARYGVVLAGGRSTRFGDQDKAVADLAGTPMLRRTADRLAGFADRVVVNCRGEQRTALEDVMTGYDRPVRFAVDPEPDRGPLAGIRTGLRAVESWGGPDALAAVVACDMPFLEPALLAYLFERAGGDGSDEGHDAAVVQLDDQWYQTTQAVYRAGPMAAACADALDRDEGKILAALFELDYEVVSEREALAHADRHTFENVNTREEFAEAERRLE